MYSYNFADPYMDMAAPAAVPPPNFFQRHPTMTKIGGALAGAYLSRIPSSYATRFYLKSHGLVPPSVKNPMNMTEEELRAQADYGEKIAKHSFPLIGIDAAGNAAGAFLGWQLGNRLSAYNPQPVPPPPPPVSLVPAPMPGVPGAAAFSRIDFARKHAALYAHSMNFGGRQAVEGVQADTGRES